MDIYLTWIKRQDSAKPQRLYSDQERTLSTWYINQCEAKGIKIEHSVRHTHDQNGRIKSAGEAIVIIARSLLLGARLPSKLWNYTIQAAVYINNQRPPRNHDSQRKWNNAWIILIREKSAQNQKHLFGLHQMKSYIERN
jgi:hypothetical protein